MRILVIQDNETGETPEAIRFYRTLTPIAMMEAISPGTRVEFVDARHVKETSFWHTDIVLAEKPYMPRQNRLLQVAKTCGCMVWIDEDDNRIDMPPKGNAGSAFYAQPGVADALFKAYEMADFITTTTEYLAGKLRQYNDNVHVVPNAWNDFRFVLQAPEEPKTGLRQNFVWRGASMHLPDFDQVQNPLRKLVAGGKAGFAFLGFAPHWIGVEAKNWTTLAKYWGQISMAARTPNTWLWVALAKHPFNQAKSNIAWIEATIVGMPTILPGDFPELDKVPALRYFGEKGFEKVLSDVIAGKYSDQRTSLVLESQKILMDHYRLSHWVQERIKILKKG